MFVLLSRIFIVFIFIFIFMTASEASDKYFLCGPDEDGCSPKYYNSCLCMPFDGALADSPYCLDLIHLRCLPVSLDPGCRSGDRVKNQETCLSTLFQSEPATLPLKRAAFCMKHHIALCPKDGSRDDCVIK